jgi:hypothetical protein
MDYCAGGAGKSRRKRKYSLHRKLGLVAIAIGATLSTIWVFVAVWKGWDVMTAEVKANRPLLPSYLLFVGLGLLTRRRPEWHKRFLRISEGDGRGAAVSLLGAIFYTAKANAKLRCC